jgi:hypothetical protein
MNMQAIAAECANLLQRLTAGKIIAWDAYTNREPQTQFVRFRMIYANLPSEAIPSLRRKFPLIQSITKMLKMQSDSDSSHLNADRSIKACPSANTGPSIDNTKKIRRDPNSPKRKYFQPEMFENVADFETRFSGVGHRAAIHVVQPNIPADIAAIRNECPKLLYQDREDVDADLVSDNPDFIVSSICAISKNLQIVLYDSDDGGTEEGISAIFDRAFSVIDAHKSYVHIINFPVDSDGLSRWREAFKRWVQRAKERKVLFIGAAGDSGTNDPNQMMLASEPEVLAVGGVVYENAGEQPSLYSKSNFGWAVRIHAAARSAFILEDGEEIEKFGTSFAAARLSAIIGLVVDGVMQLAVPQTDPAKFATVKDQLYELLKGPVSGNWDNLGYYEQITKDYGIWKNNEELVIRVLRISGDSMNELITDIAKRILYPPQTVGDYCNNKPRVDIGDWERQARLHMPGGIVTGQFSKSVPGSSESFIAAGYASRRMKRFSIQLMSVGVNIPAVRDLMKRHSQRIFDYCVPVLNCNPLPPSSAPVMLDMPTIEDDNGFLVYISIRNTSLAERITLEMLQCVFLYQPTTKICLADQTCRDVEFLFVSYIMRDGLGDAVGMARTIMMITKIYTAAKFRVIIDDMYSEFGKLFNIADESDWPLGYKKFVEMIRGLTDSVSATVIGPENAAEVCSLFESQNVLTIAGPSGSFTDICGGNLPNLVRIQELDNSKNSFGFHPDGLGIPLPDSSELAPISQSRFQTPQLAQLFQGPTIPLFAYMKDATRLISFLKELRQFIVTKEKQDLDVILLGFKDRDLAAILCYGLKSVKIRDYSTGGQQTIPCTDITVRSVNIHYYGTFDLPQMDFMLAMSKSYDIVGVTGDQSFLEALAMGKIPVRDNVAHKIFFDMKLREFYEETANADDALMKFMSNVENNLPVRQPVNSTQLPAMKQKMQEIVRKMRSNFDPLPRIRKAIEEKARAIPPV